MVAIDEAHWLKIQEDVPKSLDQSIKQISFFLFENLEKNNFSLPEEKAYLFDIEGILDEILVYSLYPVLVNQPRDTV